MRYFAGTLGALMLFSGSLMAETRVAFVEVPRILERSTQVKAVQEKIRKEFASRDDDLVAQQKQIKKLRDQLANDGSIMSEAEARRLERDILARQRKLKTSQSEFQEDLTLRQNEELGKLRKVIAEVIAEVAKSEKLDLVLEGGVVWASDNVNITDKVIERLNKR